MTANDFSILVVCDGNVCRSPFAAQSLIAHLEAAGVRATVSSAGLIAMAGAPMDAEMARLSIVRGADPSAHSATALRPRHIDDSDLVLSATRDERAEIVSLVPRASSYTFTLNEFARLAARLSELSSEASVSPTTDPVARLHTAVQHVAARRGYDPPPDSATADDTSDPYHRGRRFARRVASEIDVAISEIARYLVHAWNGDRVLQWQEISGKHAKP